MTAVNLAGGPSLTVAQANEIARKIVDPMFRDSKPLEMLRRKGRVVKNCASEKYEWRVKMATRTPTDYKRGDPISTPQTNRWNKAELGYRAFTHGESIDKFTQLANRGKDKIFDIWSETITALEEEMMDYLARGFYVDGNATGNEAKVHGIESCLGNSTAVNSKWSFLPNDTYAGLLTNLGHYGGTYTDFPIGSYTEDSCFWSPILADPTYSGWSGTSHTWALQWRQAIENVNTYMEQLRGKALDCVLMTAPMYLDVKNSLAADEGIQVLRGPNESLAVKLGYDHIWLDGVTLMQDRYCPANTAYGIIWDALQLRTMNGQLFVKEDQADITDLTKKIVFEFFGNYAIKSPGYLAKFYDF